MGVTSFNVPMPKSQADIFCMCTCTGMLSVFSYTINTQRRDHHHRTSVHPRSCELCLCLVTLVIDTLLK